MTEMGRFLKKIGIYCAVLLIMLVALNYQYKRTLPPDYTDKFQDVPDNICVFNLGSSHGLCSFCYEGLESEGECFNFGMNSQTLSYDYRLLQQYEEKLTPGGVCFIVISYFSLLEDEENNDNFEAKNARYYKFLDPRYIKQYDLSTDIRVRYFPVLSSNEALIGILTKKPSDVNQFELDWERVANADEAVQNAENAVLRHIGAYEKDGTWSFREEELNALEDIIIFCWERGIKAVMITTPYLQEYNQRVPEEFKNYFTETISRVSMKYGVEYYDYSGDDDFSENYELFMNSDHLNKTGAKKFTGMLWQNFVE